MIWRVVLWSLICWSPLAAAADELPPPQDDAARPQRAERRERLRRLGGQLFDALLPPEGTRPLDVEQLNRVLADLLAPLAGAQGYLESIELKLVPEATDLAADRAALRASALLRHSVWSPEPSRFVCTVGGRVEGIPEGLPAACVDAEATLETEVLPLANFALARARDRLAVSVQRESGDGSPTFAQLAYDKLGRTGRITTLDELADVLIYLAGLQLQAINAQIESLHAALSEGPAEPQRSELVQRLQEARARRDRLFEVRPRIQRDEAGVAQSLTVSLSPTRLGMGMQVEQLELVVTERTVGLRAGMRMQQGIEWYLAVKPVVAATLVRLQSGDAALLDSLRAMRDQWQRRAQELLAPPADGKR
jgi:hypothetical protein